MIVGIVLYLGFIYTFYFPFKVPQCKVPNKQSFFFPISYNMYTSSMGIPFFRFLHCSTFEVPPCDLHNKPYIVISSIVVTQVLLYNRKEIPIHTHAYYV